MTGWKLSGHARDDLLDMISTGSEIFGLEQARIYHEDLHKVFDLLAGFPQMARERGEFDPPIRVHRHRRHYIAYLCENDHILIIRIVPDAADLARLFGAG